MSEWKKIRLGELIEHKKGFAFKSSMYQSTGQLIVRVSDTTTNSIDISNCHRISDEIAKEYKSVELKENDIVIMTVGSWADNPNSVVGKVIKVPKTADGALLNQNAVRIRANNSSNQIYLYYLLKTSDFSGYLLNNAQGSANQASITLEDIFSYEFLLPSVSIREAIASTLYSIDNKIDLFHRQNKTLEKMAETLFRQWFVEEALGDWEEGVLDDIMDFNPTYNLSKGSLAPYLEMKNVSSNTFNPEGWYDREFTSGMRFKNGDTLLARITPCLENGKTCYVTFLEENQIGWGSTEYIVMRMKEPFHPFISYLIAKSSDFRDYAITSMSGSSGRQRAQASVLAEYSISIPDEKSIDQLNQQLDPILKKLDFNANQIRTLENLRDTLLPKLMSGEVTIADE